MISAIGPPRTVIQPTPTTATISGTVTTSTGVLMSGVSVDNGALNTSTNGSGYYSFGGLAAGSYTITPTAINYTFLPTSRNVNLNGDNATDQDFTAAYNAIPDVSDLRGLVLAANLSNTRLQPTVNATQG